MRFKPKVYKKELNYSYALGAFPTVELLKAFPGGVVKVYLHTKYRDDDGTLAQLCQVNRIPTEMNDRVFKMLSPKENCYVIGVFFKQSRRINGTTNHIALVRPGDRGNMGTVLRTAVGFETGDVAVISGGVDVFDPKVIRASMGAVFHANVEYFDTVEEYTDRFADRELFLFMLGGAVDLSDLRTKRGSPFTLVFGNEASGLPKEYEALGTSVVIRHSGKIDSLNLPTAVALGLYGCLHNATAEREQ